MSGICAIVNFDGEPVDPQVLRAMAEQCAYRGPDGIHYWINGNVGLAHLSLHATPESMWEYQPKISKDGMLCLSADVRVDNRPELIGLLAENGEVVSPNTPDADLILAAYRIWGETCPVQIIGDFAFAIWDGREQKLFCARDAFGIKPLHYSKINSTLCIASEAQQIVQHPQTPFRLDEVTIADYLANNVSDETRTMFQDVHKLPPAHSLSADRTGLQIKRYWDIDPQYRTVHSNDDEYAAHFLALFRRAVADRLRTPLGTSVGVTMSGGMDSTSVAAVARQIIKAQADQPHLLACSYVFEKMKECDESVFSQPVADKLGIELINIPAEKFRLLDNEEIFSPSLETPFMSEESLTRHILGSFAQRRARVWFSGHGGDSIVGGSTFIYADRVLQGDLSVFQEIARLYREYNLPVTSLFAAYLDWVFRPLIPEALKKIYRAMKRPVLPKWLNADFKCRTRTADRMRDTTIPKRFSEFARQDNYQKIISLGGVGRAISYQDRLAAQYQMEARYPFLDRRLVEYVLSIPPEQILRGWQRKYILRLAMRGILPESTRTRLWKTNLENYFKSGLVGRNTEMIGSLLDSSLLEQYKIIDFAKLKKSFQGRSDSFDFFGLWRLVTMELWLKKYYP
ncbi:MAG: hypothetical protein HZB50_07685 [Chloroflexi bacterium]|nr:hypothetical protein [Chloroflexota bacterium]